MKHNTFLVKPASSLCNLRCRYCFYDDVSNSRACKNMGLLSHEMAGELVEKAFAATEEGGSVHFLFQGGEPTLAGLDFFRFFLETERSMQRNISVFHSIQTNGICLDEEWASFFKANSFLVGLSLDGTQENHDLYRLDAAGQGTWDKVTHALALLDAYRVETNLLCVVTGQLARKPQRAFKIPYRRNSMAVFCAAFLMFGISSCSRDIISASVISKIICASCWECRRPPVHPPAPVDTILQ